MNTIENRNSLYNEIMNIFSGKLNKHNYKSLGALRIITALFLIGFMFYGNYQLYFSESGKKPRTTATVIENQQHILGNGTNDENTIYTPVLQYSVNGVKYQSSHGVQARNSPYFVGQKVEIQYDPDNPDYIYQPNKSRLMATITLITLFGVMGLGLLIKTVKQIIYVATSSS